MNPRLFKGQMGNLFPKSFILMGLTVHVHANSQNNWCFRDDIGIFCEENPISDGVCTERREGPHTVQSGYISKKAKVEKKKFGMFKKWENVIIPKIGKFAQICSKAQIENEVHLEDVIVLEGAKIQNGALIRSDSNGPLTLIGRRTVVKKADIGKRVVIGQDSEIGDDVTIGEDVSIGDHVKIFDHVKIGPKTYIGRHTTVGEKSVINGAFIGEGVSVRANASIGDVHIDDGVVVHSGVILANSEYISKGRQVTEPTASPDPAVAYVNHYLDPDFNLIAPASVSELIIKHDAEDFIYQLQAFRRISRMNQKFQTRRDLKRYAATVRSEVTRLNEVRPRCEFCGQGVEQGFIFYTGYGVNDRGRTQHLFQVFHREECFGRFWDQNLGGMGIVGPETVFLPEPETFSPRNRELSNPQLLNRSAELFRLQSFGRF